VDAVSAAGLDALGWDEALAASFEETAAKLHNRELIPGRIIRQERKLVRVATPDGEIDVRTAGRLERASRSEELPVIGDFVATTPPVGGGEGLIHAVLTRRNVLLRREAGAEHRAQAMAANVDQVLIVWGIDRPVNARWLERAAALVRGSSAHVVVVLTKADLCSDPDAERAGALKVLPDAEVILTSAKSTFGLDALLERLPPRTTSVMLGMSGAGKSTLINALLGEERLATKSVREDDRKGRHTTTHRELLVLQNGALLVDSPGLRELGLWAGGEESIADTFGDVEQVALQCRFSACRHGAEPGCAVREAVERGELEPARLESFGKLQRELEAKARPFQSVAQPQRKRHEKAPTRGRNKR